WRRHREESLAGYGLCADSTQSSTTPKSADQRRSCHESAQMLYRESGGLRSWSAFAHVSLSTLDWLWLGPRVSSQIREAAQSLPAALDQGRGLLISGCAGSGKTHIALGLGLIAIAHGHSVFAVSLSELRLLLNYNRAENEFVDDYLEQIFTQVDLLILDNVGRDTPPPWVIDRLSRLMRARTRRKRATITTSPLLPDQLAAAWGDVFAHQLLRNSSTLRLTNVCSYRQLQTALSLGDLYQRRQETALPSTFPLTAVHSDKAFTRALRTTRSWQQYAR
ncbi:MAG: ATP-binding protein, partial [Caldilineaceae bacterium]|nr:ATP-binding protein [Caldilineaceae bacterium]